MAKFEINNPVALKFIADFKSGVLFQPIIAKIKKIRWILISIFLVIVFILFFLLGKNLFNKSTLPVFSPPNLDSERVVTPTQRGSIYDSLKEEIYNFSTELPDPVMPDLNNDINLKKEEF